MAARKRFRKYLAIGAITAVCAVLFLMLGYRMGSNPEIGSIYPRAYIHCIIIPEEVHVGQSGEIKVFILDARDLYGISLEVFHDPRLISIDGISWGGFMESGPTRPIIPVNTVGSQDGRAVAACLLTGDVEGISGDGHLLTIDFTAKDPGVISMKKGTLDDGQPLGSCLFNFTLGTSDLKPQPYTFKAFKMEIIPRL
ncbi:MAG TPA: hypothetical protein GXZ32_07510 [Clostridiales bacterium]|nr:hypothetical protein [Clostridiales bacterium]